MTDQRSNVEAEARVDELSAHADVDRRRIDALEARAAAAERRADASEARVDANHARVEEDRSRIDALEARAAVDRELVDELVAEGLVNREEVEHLREALKTSRTIGAAIGIVMANRRVDEHLAFEVLRKASSVSNRKLRSIAEDVVLTGNVEDLPML